MKKVSRNQNELGCILMNIGIKPALLMLSLATGLWWSCSPIEPGEEGSATTAKATVEGATTGTNPPSGGGEGSATTGGETSSAAGGVQTTSFPELTIPTALTDKDKEAGLKYGFALVCETLYGADKNEETLVVSTSGDSADTTVTEQSAATDGEDVKAVQCIEGPDVSTLEAWNLFSGVLRSEMVECQSKDHFWDHTGEGSCVDVEELTLDCPYKNMVSELSGVKDIASTFEGYEGMGWRIEQCGRKGNRYWLNLSTVIAVEGKHKYILKTVRIDQLGEVCKGRSGGVCAEAAAKPETEVLFISSPFDRGF